jgi:hypothetical protein
MFTLLYFTLLYFKHNIDDSINTQDFELVLYLTSLQLNSLHFSTVTLKYVSIILGFSTATSFLRAGPFV